MRGNIFFIKKTSLPIAKLKSKCKYYKVARKNITISRSNLLVSAVCIQVQTMNNMKSAKFSISKATLIAAGFLGAAAAFVSLPAKAETKNVLQGVFFIPGVSNLQITPVSDGFLTSSNMYISGKYTVAVAVVNEDADDGSEIPGGDGDVAVPEPTTIGGLALGFGALMKWRNSRRNK